MKKVMKNAPSKQTMSPVRDSVSEVSNLSTLRHGDSGLAEKRTLDELREILDQIEPKAAYLYYYITVTSNDNSVTVPSVSEAKDQSVQPSGS